MRLVLTLLTALLVVAIGLSAALLLRSCGVRLPFTQQVLGFCEDPELSGVRAELSLVDRANTDLNARIRGLEQDLAALTCEADPPPLPPPPPPPKPKPPAKPQTPSGLKPDAFDGRDLSVMEGCWQLSSDYAVRDINTGKITRFKYWRICFDKNGNGTEQMRATDGARCNGRLTGRMPGNGSLIMREPGNLQCDNGASIFRRDVTCKLDARGNAQCDTYQPETRGRGEATLRRAGR
ncbi:hypothetical protein I5535_06435 [Rhodobacteraceae bacterium F11138]|nr:hypothetical protein [Rhodobacteraceae bacterium F11138]